MLYSLEIVFLLLKYTECIYFLFIYFFRYEDHNGVPISVPISRQFKEILKTIYESKYYVSDPKKACLFVPSLDLLNQNFVRLKETAQVLATLPQ